MLSLSNLKVDIEGSRILNGISLSVAAGELVCLVGRNGAGKTTTFRTIMGYRRPLLGRHHLRRRGPDEIADLADRAGRHRLFARGVGSLCRSDGRGEYRAVDVDPTDGSPGRRSHRGGLRRIPEVAPVSRPWRRAAFRRRAQDGIDCAGIDARSRNYCFSTNPSKACRRRSFPRSQKGSPRSGRWGGAF